MARGGPRPGSGRRVTGEKLEFRKLVSGVMLKDPKARKTFIERMRTDPEFCIKAWIAAYGYPRQDYEVRLTDERHTVRRATLSDGTPAVRDPDPPTLIPVPEGTSH